MRRKLFVSALLVTLAAPSLAAFAAEKETPQTNEPVAKTSSTRLTDIPQTRVIVRLDFGQDDCDLQAWFTDYFKVRCANSGIEILIWSDDGMLEEGNDIVDYQNESGRYNPRTVPAKGNYEGATNKYKVTVRDWFEEKSLGNIGGLFGLNRSADLNMVVAKVELSVSDYDVEKGSMRRGWIAKGSAKGVRELATFNFRAWGRDMTANLYNVEKTVVGKAAKAAVDDFIKKLSPPKPAKTKPSN